MVNKTVYVNGTIGSGLVKIIMARSDNGTVKSGTRYLARVIACAVPLYERTCGQGGCHDIMTTPQQCVNRTTTGTLMLDATAPESHVTWMGAHPNATLSAVTKPLTLEILCSDPDSGFNLTDGAPAPAYFTLGSTIGASDLLPKTELRPLMAVNRSGEASSGEMLDTGVLEAGSGADGSGEASSGEMLDTGVLEAGSGAGGSGEASSGEAVSVGGGRMDVVYDTTPNHKAFSARITLDADHPLHANIVDGSWLYATLSCQ